MTSHVGYLFVVPFLSIMVTCASGTAEDVRRNGNAPGDHTYRVVQEVDPSSLQEGWKLTIDVPKTLRSMSATCRLSVERGWLHVKRESEHGLEWQVVLAEVVKSAPLEIAVVRNQPAIEISYGEGRYFVKDTAHALRILRQRKVDQSSMFTRDECMSNGEPRGRAYFDLKTGLGTGNEQENSSPGTLTATVLQGWEKDGWFFVSSGGDKETFDSLVRLNPNERATSGYGFQAVHGGLTYAFHGKTWACDDGELLVAFRMLPDDYRRLQQIERIRANLPGSSPPIIDATKWLNSRQALSWGKLKDKVVLVDFWGTWCGPCVQKLPEVQGIHTKYAHQGLVVLGVHTSQGADSCESFVRERGITFPIAIDSGETERAFGVTSVPNYFLIDRQGKVIYGYSATLPPTELLESTLRMRPE